MFVGVGVGEVSLLCFCVVVCCQISIVCQESGVWFVHMYESY